VSQIYKNDIVDLIVELLRDNLGTTFFKEYYNGDPELIALSMMPCVTVKVEDTEITSISTAQDMERHTVLIKLVASKRNEFNKSANEVTIERTLRQLASGRDKSTNRIADTTVVGILRKYYSIDSKTHGQVGFGVAYPGDTFRGEGTDGLTAEAHIRMQIDVLATVTRS